MPSCERRKLWRLCKKRAIIAGMKTSDRNPAAILRSLKKYTQPVTGALQAEAGNHKEFTIDELAREAGSTVRIGAFCRPRKNADVPVSIPMCIWRA